MSKNKYFNSLYCFIDILFSALMLSHAHTGGGVAHFMPSVGAKKTVSAAFFSCVAWPPHWPTGTLLGILFSSLTTGVFFKGGYLFGGQNRNPSGGQIISEGYYCLFVEGAILGRGFNCLRVSLENRKFGLKHPTVSSHWNPKTPPHLTMQMKQMRTRWQWVPHAHAIFGKGCFYKRRTTHFF